MQISDQRIAEPEARMAGLQQHLRHLAEGCKTRRARAWQRCRHAHYARHISELQPLVSSKHRCSCTMGSRKYST